MFCIFWRVSMQNDRPIFARPVGHELDPPSSLCRSDAFLQDTPAPLALKSTLANLPVSGLFLVTAFANFRQNRRQINLPPFGSDVCSRSATLSFSIFLGGFPEISRHLSAPCG